MVLGLILYGSAARGDSDKNSDTDLLAISEGGFPSSSKKNKVEVQYLPKPILLDMARSGNLFAIHLAYEGKVVFEHDRVFTNFKQSLVIRRSYAKERGHAADLASLLISHQGSPKSLNLINKRIAWCVRTVLISRLVEQGRIIFSPAELSRQFPYPEVSSLLRLRRESSQDADSIAQLKSFCDRFSLTVSLGRDLDFFRRRFMRTGNSVGLSTLIALERSDDERVLSASSAM